MTSSLMNSQASRPTAFQSTLCRPRASRAQRLSVVAHAKWDQQEASSKAPVIATAAFATAAALAVAPAAQAAQEAFQLAEGEPLIVQIGWSASAAVFSFSLALVVWGRSGM